MLALTRKFNLLLLLRGSNVCRIRIGIPVSNPLHFKRSSLATNTLPSANGFKVFDSLVLPISGLSIPAFLLHGFRAAMVVETGVGGSGSGGSGDGGGNTGGGTGGSNWSFLPWYLSLLAKYPVMTKAVTSAFLTLVGDLVCQLAIDQVPSLNMKRTSIFTLLGLVLVGPTLHFWYFF